MASRSIDLTIHAVERFRSRVVPHLSLDDAETLLSERLESASPIKRRSVHGTEQWRITEPDAVLLVVRERRRLVCRTVLDLHTAENRAPLADNVDPWEENNES